MFIVRNLSFIDYSKTFCFNKKCFLIKFTLPTKVPTNFLNIKQNFSLLLLIEIKILLLIITTAQPQRSFFCHQFFVTFKVTTAKHVADDFNGQRIVIDLLADFRRMFPA